MPLGPFEHHFTPSAAGANVARHLLADWLVRLPVEGKAAEDILLMTAELCANAVRHAHARSIGVQLTAKNESIELRVDDDGIGFVASARMGSGLGLRSIDERVRLARGHVSVESRPGLGTNLPVTIPQPAAHAELSRV